jgi:hypothetical protein
MRFRMSAIRSAHRVAKEGHGLLNASGFVLPISQQPPEDRAPRRSASRFTSLAITCTVCATS